MINADIPISSSEDDRLGRKNFAQQVARSIAGIDVSRNSFVIGLNGEWGSGKTSVKNIIIEFLKTNYESTISPIDFNPWQFSGSDLIQLLFRDLSIVMGQDTAPENEKYTRIAIWKAYGAVFNLAAYVATATRAGILLAGENDGGVLNFVANHFKQAGSFFKEMGEFNTAKADVKKKTLSDLKKDLVVSLATMNKTIVVFIDDIDRLNREEVKLIFQLVKANADFPKIIYVLLFQKDIVENHLEESGINSGGEYLKKIIQVSFDIPAVSKFKIMEFLDKELMESMKDADNNFDSNYWSELRNRGTEKFFSNLRDVNTFLNSFKFHLALFKGEKSLNVNYVDLFAIELIRVFEHNVYEALYTHKKLLTKSYTSFGADLPQHKQALSDSIHRIISQSSEKNKDAVQNILSVIFPNIEWDSSKSYNSRRSYQESVNEVRAANSLYFDRYFSFRIEDNELSESDISNIKESLGNRSNLVTILQGINEKGQLDQALFRMKAFENELKPEYANDFITALCDISDDLPKRTGGYDFDPKWNLWSIAYWYLQTLDTKARFEVLKHAIAETHGLFLPLDLVGEEFRILDQRNNGKPFTERQYYTEEELQELKQMCLEKLKNSQKYSGYKLAEHKSFCTILHILKWFKSEDELKEQLYDLFNYYDHFFIFLECFVYERSGRIHYKDIESFVDMEKFESLIKKVTERTTDPRQKYLLNLWNETLDRKAHGIADDSSY